MTTIPDGSRYFLYHSIGQYPGKAADLGAAMAEFAASWSRPDDGQWPYALGRRQAFIDRWRAIIDAPDGTVTTTESVTSGLSAVMGALPAGHLGGRRVLVAGDCFPSVHFLLSGLAERMGFTLTTVPMRPGAAWTEDEDIRDAWTADVGLALLTWISSTSSHRSDVGALAAHGRRMGTIVGADITQGAGLLPFSAAATGVDFALSTSLKWMCGTPGAGMLYVTPGLTAASEPGLRGWFSQPDPFNWDFGRFSYAPDVRRFDHGTPGVMAALASLPALDWHARQDGAALLAHNRALSARLLDGLDALGLATVSPRDPARRGGSIMLDLPDDRDPAATLARFRSEGIAADTRGRRLRLSPGVMTSAAGVDALLRSLAARP